MGRRVCLLVLCGLPAAGKTTLAHRLGDKLSKNGNVRLFRVSYDELMPSEIEKELITKEKSTEQSHWKEYRKAILSCIEQEIALLHGLQFLPESINVLVPSNLKEKTRFLLDQKMALKDCNECQIAVFIIDDNMYYRGMRYDYYQLARKYECSFAQVHVICSLDEAVRRNASRESRVQETVIKTMAERFEAPDLSQTWEKCSISVNPTEENTDIQIDKITKLVETSLENPVKDHLAEMELQQEISRRITSTSTLHQIDQVLRKIVANLMQQAKGNDSDKDQMKTFAEKIKMVKLDITRKLKSGEIYISDAEVPRDAAKNPHSPVFQMFEAMFRQKIEMAE